MCRAVDLEVLKRSGSDSEKRHAVRIMPVIEKQHLLLVTLLLVNAAAMEALPIFIDKVCPPVPGHQSCLDTANLGQHQALCHGY